MIAIVGPVRWPKTRIHVPSRMLGLIENLAFSVFENVARIVEPM
jgi:hypothetical protein